MRALFDDGGNRVDEAGPSIPVQVVVHILLRVPFVLIFYNYFSVLLRVA